MGVFGLAFRTFSIWVFLFVSILAPAAYGDTGGVLAILGIFGFVILFIALVPVIIGIFQAGQSGEKGAKGGTRDPRVDGIARDIFPDEQALPSPGASQLDHFLNKRLPSGESVVSFVMKAFNKHAIYLPESYADRVFSRELNQPFFQKDGEIRRLRGEKIDPASLPQRRAQNLKQTIEQGIRWIEKLVQNHREEVETGAELIARRFLVRLAALVKQREPLDEVESLLRHESLTPQERYAKDVDFFYAWLQAFEKSLKNSNIMKPEARHMVGTQPGMVERVQHRINEIVSEYLEITSNRRRLQQISSAGAIWDEVLYQMSVTRSESFDRKTLRKYQELFLNSTEPFRRQIEMVDIKNLSVEDLKNMFQDHALFPQRIVMLGNRTVAAKMAADQYNHDLGPFSLHMLLVPDYGREEPEEADSPTEPATRRKNAEGLKGALSGLLEKVPLSHRNEMLREVFSEDDGPVDKLGRYILILPIAKELTYEDEMALAALRFFPPSGLDRTLIAVVSFVETDLLWNSGKATKEQRNAAYEFFLSFATAGPLLR
ncbi:MAG: hypothetical protein ABIH23_26825 [bacterium]